MKKRLAVVVCLLLAIFATPVFADIILVDIGNNVGYMYDEYYPNAKYYIKDLDRFFTYIMYAVALRNKYDYSVYVTTQYYYLGDRMYKYNILCGEGLVVIQLYRPVGTVYLDELAIILSAEDIEFIEETIAKYGLPEFPKD